MFFLSLFVVAHILLRVRSPYADPYLLPLGGLLCAIGLTEIYRIDPDLAFRQGLWVVVGVIAFAGLVLFLRDYRELDNIKYILGVSAIVLLVLPALPGIGRTINGATLWVDIGPIVFQPGELAKVLIVIFLAGYLRDNREMLSYGAAAAACPRPSTWGRCSSSGAARCSCSSRPVTSGARSSTSPSSSSCSTWPPHAGRSWPWAGALLAGAVALYQVIPHVQTRVQGWLDPWSDPHGDGYQLVQSIYAISSGGVFGSGLGNGVLLTPEGNPYIPFLETDFIFSAIAQELGLAGAAAVILLYLLFAFRGFRIAMMADDGFSKLLAVWPHGSGRRPGVHHHRRRPRLIPLTGITLPFVSYGGSSVVANFIVLALLLMVSDRANRGEQR